jgi:hypothetical protein
MYLAFAKIGTFPGTSIIDRCTSTQMSVALPGGEELEDALPDCVGDLYKQLLIIFVAKTAFQQTMEIVKPMIGVWYRVVSDCHFRKTATEL